ncbi:MAG: RagB/SusD family nutrient uptake outer membrane protein [Bacteroidaceae bacterium]|nr:RagB/SusD family nutrient uptake outer membrane protein [Bacteroidaceae bacterium]
MFNDKNDVDYDEEVVTVIPSSNNKLWGTVFRGINDLCGFTTAISVSTDTSSTTTSSVSLTLNYEHELNSAPAYKRLSQAQDYEMYLGKEGEEVLTVVKDAGDSRYKIAVSNYTNTAKGDNTPTEFIVKQLGGGGFSTTYPVIYRKGNIWLRYAEALNGAGFPGYAFAILKNGLCGNTIWLPTDERQYEPASMKYYDPTETIVSDEGVRDTTFYEGTDLTAFFYRIYLQAYAADAITATTDSLTKEYFTANIRISELEYSHYRFTYNENGDVELLSTLITDIWNYFTSKAVYGAIVTSYSEIPNQAYSIVCNHIAKREMLAAKDAENATFLNFSTQYLRGSAYGGVMYTRGETEYQTITTTYSGGMASDFTMGIHNRGCGLLMFNETESTFNYVDQINKMLTTYEGEAALTRAEIYDTANLDKVQVAVADLILDEMALETAFEGSRFFDLMRYARFRGDNDQLARRVAQRGETEDAALRSYLRNTDNWYFKLPQR